MTVFEITESNEATSVVMESAINGTGQLPVPLVMPSCDRYYWSPRWQSDEAETLEDDERVIFDSDNAEDAAEWLRQPEDDQ